LVRVPGAVMCYTWTMGIKKRTKPSVPGRKKAALNLAKTRLFRYRNKYATLWEAAKQYSKTKHFKVVARSAKKQMIKQHGEAYYQKFLKDKKRQIKFVLNLFREIKGDGKQYPKMLHQTEETGFTPPKWIISMSKEIGKDGRAKPNKARLDYANFKRANKRPLKDRMKELKTFRKK